MSRCARKHLDLETQLAFVTGFALFSRSVQTRSTIFAHESKSALALLLTVLLFAASFFAVSPLLHDLVHGDAAGDSHQCAITMLAQHQLLSNEAQPVLTVLVSGLISSLPAGNLTAISAVDCTSHPTRAPPGSFVS